MDHGQLETLLRTHDRRLTDVLRRIADLPALWARHSRRSTAMLVRTTADLTPGQSCMCTVQIASFTPAVGSGPIISATLSDTSPAETLKVFDLVLILAGYSSKKIASGTYARIEQEARSGVWYFTDFYACPVSVS